MKRIALFDLSGIFRQAWHASEHSEISAAFNRTVSTIVTSSAGYDHVAVCADRPPYKRREISKDYKAQREKAPEAMYEQLRAVEEKLDADGFHIVGSLGYEADDIIAQLTEWAQAQGHEVTIYSADKDLLQLVGERVSVISTATRQKYATAEEVKAKLGVLPGLVPDWLALVGDKSDNIPGVPGVGPKTASGWLNEIGGLDVILQDLEHMPEKWRDVLRANKETLSTSWRLAQLMTDAPINPEIILTTKEKKEAPAQEPAVIEEDEPTPEVVAPQAQQSTSLVVNAPQPLEPVSWDRQLEPRDNTQAWWASKMFYESRLFGHLGNREAIFSIVMTGRAIGLDAMTSLRQFDLIEGRPSPKAQLLVGLVKKFRDCEYFRLVSTDEKAATYETRRKGDPEPTRLTYTYAQADAAGHVKARDGGVKKNWRDPATMLRWRCAVALARIVYPDVVAGLYAAEELEAD